ncbi:unnamed protein product [Urochloa humidicola]
MKWCVPTCWLIQVSIFSIHVKVEKKQPKELVKAPKSVRYFKSWSRVDYYQNENFPLCDHLQVIRAAKSDSRLPSNYLHHDIQKLRCGAFFQALRFAPPIEALGYGEII